MQTRLFNLLVVLCVLAFNQTHAVDKQLYEFGKVATTAEIEAKKSYQLTLAATNVAPVNATLENLKAWVTYDASVAAASNLYGNVLTRNAYYIDGAYGSDTNDGSSGRPWATIGHAETNAVVGSSIYISSGIYLEQITRGGVTWVLSRGCELRSTDSNIPVVKCFASTNYTILGEGSLRNMDSGIVLNNFDSDLGVVYDCNVEIDCRYIQGSFQFYADQTLANRLYVKNALWFGSIGTISTIGAGFGSDIQFTNVRLYTASAINLDASIDTPFSVVGCVVNVTPNANPARIGTWLVNTNIPVLALP